MTEGFLLIHPGTGEITAWKDGRPHVFEDYEEAVREIANAMIEHWKDVSEGRTDIDDIPVAEDIEPCTLHPDGAISTEDEEWSPRRIEYLNKQRNT